MRAVPAEAQQSVLGQRAPVEEVPQAAAAQPPGGAGGQRGVAGDGAEADGGRRGEAVGQRAPEVDRRAVRAEQQREALQVLAQPGP